MSELVSTDDVVSREELEELLGTKDLEDTIPTCAGEWRRTPRFTSYSYWRFWMDPNL